MGFISNIFGKKEPEYKKLLPFFEESFELLTNFAIEQIDNDKHSDTVKIGTSASAVVAAAYFMNNVGGPDGRFVNPNIASEVVDISNSFFDCISVFIVKCLEREMGEKININEWGDTLSELQQDKVGTYIVSIRRIMEKSRGVTCGADLTNAVSKDLFGEEVFDIIVSARLFALICSVKL